MYLCSTMEKTSFFRKVFSRFYINWLSRSLICAFTTTRAKWNLLNRKPWISFTVCGKFVMENHSIIIAAVFSPLIHKSNIHILQPRAVFCSLRIHFFIIQTTFSMAYTCQSAVFHQYISPCSRNGKIVSKEIVYGGFTFWNWMSLCTYELLHSNLFPKNIF